ncbi:MAG TPA: ATP-binding protein [Candidatus Omnitrophota bacterium]|nr:response regulator [Candidatus Omnitrophota bacterium]HQO58502.1 ATP-binding protein [Candidatus Omnitrophota bacterium]
MKNRISLDFKIMISFLLVSLVPFLCTLFLIHKIIEQRVRQESAEGLITYVRLIGKQVESLIDVTLMHTTTMARSPGFVSGDNSQDAMTRRISDALNVNSLFEDIVLVDQEGRVMASTSDQSPEDWKGQPWFYAGLRGKSTVSPVQAVTMPFRLVYWTGAPVFRDDGSVSALIMGRVRLRDISQLAHQEIVRRGGQIFIVDDQGYFLHSPDYKKLLYQLEPEGLRQKVLAAQEGFWEFTDSAGVQKVCAFAVMTGFGGYPGQGWRIGIIQDRQEVFAVMNRIKQQALWIAMVGGFFIILLSPLLSMAIVDPVKKLVEASARIANGDLNSPVRISSDDEIGDLADCLNDMVRKIRFSRGELEAEKERLAVTLRSITDAVITADLQDRIILINETAEKLCGMTQEDVRNKKFTEIFLFEDMQFSPGEDPYLVQIKESCFSVKGRRRCLKNPSGKLKMVIFNAAPIKDHNNDLIGIVVVLQDITAEERIREELNKVQKLETIGVLAGGIAHDFNNILTSIVGNVSLAKFNMEPQSEEFALLTEVEKTSMEAKQLTQQLLAFSKGGAPIKKIVKVGPLIKESVDFVSRGSNVVCSYDIPGELWPAEIDAGQIRQVLHNLTINAIQAMPKGGGLQISAKNIVVQKEHNLPIPAGMYILISVQDEGVGIPEDDLPKIFSPFFTTKATGNGLGLAGSFSIIKKHGGHMTLSSRVNVGTTFHVYLPATHREVESEITMTLDIVQGQGRVLVLDDESLLRELFGQFLFRFGFEVVLTTSGEEAVEKFREAQEQGRPFSLVVLDLTIRGGMGGKDTLQELQKIDPRVKAIVTSGYSNDPVMSQYQKYGFKGMLTKPFNFDELNIIIRQVLAQG